MFLSNTATACVVAALSVIAAACSEPEDTTPPVGTMQVSLSRPKVALGSPVEVTYKFTLAPSAPSLGQRRVFVHFLDADEELMWTDDHDPVIPTSRWTPGQKVQYTRTVFMPIFPYHGPATVTSCPRCRKPSAHAAGACESSCTRGSGVVHVSKPLRPCSVNLGAEIAAPGDSPCPNHRHSTCNRIWG